MYNQKVIKWDAMKTREFIEQPISSQPTNSRGV